MMISCTDDLSNEQWKASEGEKVKLTFKVNIPEVTSATSRSFDEPSVETLHLIVFDNNGYFVEKQQATKTKTIVSDTEVTEFSVTLTASASQRTIHFIGNYDGADNLPFGSESDIIGGLKHSNGDDAYWQRLIFGSIGSETNIGTVPLIRNHARITVTESLDNFVLESFTVVNIVDEGYVAPYNQNTSAFAQFLDTDSTPLAYSTLTTGANAYTGYVPNVDVDATKEDVDTWQWIDPNAYFYLYERKHETDNQTFVIVQGKYGEEEESSYYKIEIVDNNKKYYHILRNFEYQIEITSVTGNGKGSPEEAYDMVGSHNNLVASVELQSLSNISDGFSQLYVSYTEEYIVSTEPITLQYMYIPDITQKGATNNSAATIECTQGGDVIKTYSVATSNDIDEDGEDTGWRTITINPQTPDANETKKQTLTIKAGNLLRTITYILCTPYKMSMQCYDGNGTDKSDKVVYADISEKVNVDITLPTGLPESLFPLTFYLEAEKRTLYPDAATNQLPVETEIPSIFNGGATFGYTKEVTWDEYYKNNTYNTLYTCYLLTNTESNASKVRVYNKYFSIAEDEFTNPSIIAKFEDGTQYYGQNKTVTLSLTFEKAGTYKLSSDNGSLTFTSASDATLSNNTLTVSEEQVNKEIKITCTTQTWSAIAEATITPLSPSGETIKVTGETRNRILVPAGKIRTNGSSDVFGSSSRTINVTLSSSYDNPIGSFESSRNSTNSNSFELTIDNLGDNTEDWNNKTVYFYFTRSSQTGLRKAETSLTNIMNLVVGNSNNEITLNFNI